MIDNAFVDIADWERAQQIANGLEVKRLHHRLDDMTHRFCPIYREFGVAYNWSIDKCEICHRRTSGDQHSPILCYGGPGANGTPGANIPRTVSAEHDL